MQSFIWQLLGAVLLLILQFLAARTLGAAQYGWANYLLGFAATISTFTYFGVQLYLPKELQLSKDSNRTLSSTFWTNSFIFLAASLLIYFILRYFVSAAASLIILTIAYLTLISEIMAAFYVGIGKAGAGTFIRRFLFALINIITFLVFLLFYRSGWTYLLAIIAAHTLINIPLFFTRIKPSPLNFNVIRNSLKFYVIQIVYGIYTGLSRVLQGIFGSLESVAMLSIGLLLSNIGVMMGDNFAKVVMPQFSRAWIEGDSEKIRQAYREVTRFNAYFILPVVIFGIVNAERILAMVGEEFKAGTAILALLLFSQFFGSLLGPHGYLLGMTDHENHEIMNGCLKLALALSLAFLLGARYTWGIAFSIAGSDIFASILKTLQVKKFFGFWPHTQPVFIHLVILTVIQMIGFKLIGSISGLWLFLVLNAVFGLVIYAVSFYFSPVEEDRKTVVKLIDRLARR